MMTSIFMSKNSDGGPIDSENKVMSKKKIGSAVGHNPIKQYKNHVINPRVPLVFEIQLAVMLVFIPKPI